MDPRPAAGSSGGPCLNIDQGRAACWDVSRWIACEPSEGVFLHRSQATALHQFAARRLPVCFFGGRVTLVLAKLRPTALGRRSQGGECLFRVGLRRSGARSHRRKADSQVELPESRHLRSAVDDPSSTVRNTDCLPGSRLSCLSIGPAMAFRPIP